MSSKIIRVFLVTPFYYPVAPQIGKNTPTMKLNFQTKPFNPNLFSCSSSPILFVFSEIELNFHTNKQSLTPQIDRHSKEEKFDA